LHIEVRRNGERVQTVDLRELVRDLPTLLADVGEFMTLQAGDVLMVGTDCMADGSRPRAKAGDRVEISAPDLEAVNVTVGGAA
jgi:5-oxopent-3-ene-1,2,5-tricarboxylate decarboxylase/2-hydroxyhepta-2,4-diene-1,7-dioate isomerase